MRVLVVEDHPDSAELLLEVLQQEGHLVTVVAGVSEALATARGCKFDLLISDLRLQDGTGWDLLDTLKKDCPGLAAIAISGLAYPSDFARSQEAGFCEHLSKPVDLRELRAVIKRCVTSTGSL